MRYIKTRDKVAKTVRSLNRAGNLSARMKDSLVRTIEDQADDNEYSVSELETAEAEGVSRGLSYDLPHRSQTNKNFSEGNSEEIVKDPADHPREDKEAKNTGRIVNRRLQNDVAHKARNASTERVRTINPNTVRKEAERQSIVQRVKESVIDVKQKVTSSNKAALSRIQQALDSLTAGIASRGIVAIAVITLIGFIGMIVASPYGIFLSKDNGGETITSVIQELNAEYYDRIESIKDAVNYDELETIANDGVFAIRWDEILSVYAVLCSTNSNIPMEVVTVDTDKKELLRSLFSEMNAVSSSVSTETYEDTEISLDEEGNEIEETVEKTKTTLTIRLNHKTASEEASVFGFNEKQMSFLNDMLSGRYSTLWASVIGGYSQGMGIIPSEATWVGTGSFSWPLPINGSITSGFGYRSDPFSGETVFHGGLDIAAAEGTPIIAADDGTVTVANGFDSWGGGYGFYVMIDHGDDYETLYGHCSSICVTYGQTVRKGEVIAYVGSTGNSTGNHLHFEIRVNKAKWDPLDWFT